MKIVIHYASQTRAVVALWALEEVGVPYEKVKLDLRAAEHKTEAYAKINPNQRVPALVIDGRPMFESTAMVLWLAERFGVEKKIWPAADDAARAEAMGWTVWGTAQLGQNIMALMTATSDRLPKEMHNEAQAKMFRSHIEKDLKVLDDQLAKHAYVMGDAFSLADVLPGMALMFGMMGGLDLSKVPHIGAWMQKLSARPAFQRAQAT
jgi:glutathione S-transferase